MALSFSKFFQPIQLGSSVGVLYTVPSSPSGSKTVNFKVRLVNEDTVSQAVTLYAVPSGSSPVAANACYEATMTAKQVLDIDIPVLSAGDSLQGLAGAASKVTLHHLGGMLDQ